MKLRNTLWVLVAVLALVGGIASSAFAIEAFHERFEWGDLSQPTTLHGRVAVTDPYDKAVWINIAVFGGNAESGYYWQRQFPGKNVKFYAANDAVLRQLMDLGKHQVNAAAMTNVDSSKFTLIEFVAQEPEQNHRVITSVKTLPEVAGTPGNPRSIHSLRSTMSQAESMADNSWPQNRRMKYDVMIPGGQAIAGFIPNSDQN